MTTVGAWLDSKIRKRKGETLNENEGGYIDEELKSSTNRTKFIFKFPDGSIPA